jgi:hypothetical protein
MPYKSFSACHPCFPSALNAEYGGFLMGVTRHLLGI